MRLTPEGPGRFHAYSDQLTLVPPRVKPSKSMEVTGNRLTLLRNTSMLPGMAGLAVHFASSIILRISECQLVQYLRSKKYVICLGALLTKHVAGTDLSTNNSTLKGRTVDPRTVEQHTISALSTRKGSLVGLAPDWVNPTPP
jgi:hypothetical protein